MSSATLQPETISVKRSELRQNQRVVLRKAKGRKVLLVQGNEDEKYILDKEYFDQFLRSFESLVETLEIVMDRRLFSQIMAAADTLEEDLRLGRLHSVEEVFGEE